LDTSPLVIDRILIPSERQSKYHSIDRRLDINSYTAEEGQYSVYDTNANAAYFSKIRLVYLRLQAKGLCNDIAMIGHLKVEYNRWNELGAKLYHKTIFWII
jgi:hypothetical protein